MRKPMHIRVYMDGIGVQDMGIWITQGDNKIPLAARVFFKGEELNYGAMTPIRFVFIRPDGRYYAKDAQIGEDGLSCEIGLPETDLAGWLYCVIRFGDEETGLASSETFAIRVRQDETAQFPDFRGNVCWEEIEQWRYSWADMENNGILRDMFRV